MFLGFDETYHHIEKIWDKMPPIINLLLLPYVVTVLPLSIIISIILWFLGFWRCTGCKKVFSFFIKKESFHIITGWDSGYTKTYCPNCNDKKNKLKKGE